MESEELERLKRDIIKQVLEIGYSHWLRHGSPIRTSDVDLVAQDVFIEPRSPQG